MTPPPAVVRVIRETPPAALLACPAALAPSMGGGGRLPRDKLVDLRALAAAYRANTDQLLRLIVWFEAGRCVSAEDGATK